jgi:hypothetical protein
MMVSAYGGADELGAADFLTKPVDFALLKAQLLPTANRRELRNSGRAKGGYPPIAVPATSKQRTPHRFTLPLGLVLPAWDPIRAAEELAVLDHLTKGRVYAGFARGYQDRWVNVLGQQYHVTGASMDGSAIDNHNRRVYEETLKVIKKAWTEDACEYNGEYCKFPFPYEEGIRRWPVAE